MNITKKRKLDVLRTMRRNDILVDAVIRRMGGVEMFLDNYEDIIEHGAENGVEGFIYTDDNRRFVRRYIDEIMDAIQDDIDYPPTDVDRIAWAAVEIVCERFAAALSKKK